MFAEEQKSNHRCLQSESHILLDFIKSAVTLTNNASRFRGELLATLATWIW